MITTFACLAVWVLSPLACFVLGVCLGHRRGWIAGNRHAFRSATLPPSARLFRRQAIHPIHPTR